MSAEAITKIDERGIERYQNGIPVLKMEQVEVLAEWELTMCGQCSRAVCAMLLEKIAKLKAGEVV